MTGRTSPAAEASRRHGLPRWRRRARAVASAYATRPLLCALTLTVPLLLAGWLPAAQLFRQPADYLPLHTVLEFLAMAISTMVFALAWNLRQQSANNRRTILGAGFLAVALIDLGHTLSYAGMPVMFTPSGAEKAIDFWLAARAIAALTLFGVPLQPLRRWSAALCHAAIATAVLIAAAVWWIALAHADWLPRTFVSGLGLTRFKVQAEYVLVLLYTGAALLLLRNARRERDADQLWLAAAAWVLGLTEMFFTLYADVTDLFNLLGHVYKALASLMIYRALFVAGVQAPYRQLEVERARLQSLLSTIPDLVWLKDPDGVYLSCNRQFEQFFGAQEAQIVGRTDYDFVDRDLADFFREHDRKAMAADAPSTNEEWLTFAVGGRHGLFETTKAPMHAAGGRLIGVLGIAHDITERVRAENALREKDAEYRAAIQTSADGFLTFDANGRVVESNDAYVRRSGYTADELAGMTLSDLDARETSEQIQARCTAVRHAGYAQFETLHRTKTGEIWPLEATMSYSPRSGGRLFAFFRDISERKRAEREMKQYADIIRSTEDAIIGKTPEGIVVSWNPGATALFGYRAEEMIGRSISLLFPPENSSEQGAILERISRGETVGHFETVRLRKDGRRIDVSVLVTPIRDNHGRVIGASKIARDISERKRAEGELRKHREHLEELVKERTAELHVANQLLSQAKDSAELANHAKSAFLANMSHEIRTPMNAILGMAHLLRRAGVTPAQSERLNKIDAAAKHLLAVINDILDLSKIEAHKLVLDETAVSIEALFADIRSIVQSLPQAKKVNLQLAADPFPGALRGDATRLRQALLNYVTNALKFSEHGTVAVRAIKVEEDEASVLARFEVEDNGVGIAPEALPRLFSAFEQADNSTTRKYGGTGLGLAINRRLAALMGGEVGVSSRPGQGSLFWFSARLRKGLAAASAVQPASDAESRIRHAHHGRRILIVDDETVSLEIAEALASGAGLAVDTAGDGVTALARATRTRYALILMDMQMPLLDGISATRRLRAAESAAGEPPCAILAMTANAYGEDRLACLESGMNDFIGKPLDPEVFFATLLKWLEAPPGAAGG